MQLHSYGASRAGGLTQDDARDRFLAKTYQHLFLAIATFAALEIAMFQLGIAQAIAYAVFASRATWWLIFGGFVVAGWVASFVAHTVESRALQYVALAGYVVAEAIIFAPLLAFAHTVAPGVLPAAALVTIAGFAALTAVVVFSKKSFTFLGAFLRWAGIVALLTIVAAAVFGFQLGTWFAAAMVGLAGASILYTTSRLHEDFPEDRYVAAALQLFASVATMFWYVIQLFLRSRD